MECRRLRRHSTSANASPSAKIRMDTTMPVMAPEVVGARAAWEVVMAPMEICTTADTGEEEQFQVRTVG